MLAIHEMGHVIGALATGGSVRKLVLHPLSISRTDIAPNPFPAIVVWLGPILGCLAPVAIWSLIPKDSDLGNRLATFFVGFCFIANGAYIALGSVEGIGDCFVMLQTGSPQWFLILFGASATLIGIAFWHRLGSIVAFVKNPERIALQESAWLIGILAVLVCAEYLLSPIS